MELIVEISGLSSLEKIDSSFTDDVVKHLESILKTELCSASVRQGSCFIFRYKNGGENTEVLFRSFINGYDFLSGIAEELRGFVMLAGRSGGGSLIKDLNEVREDRSFYISPDVFDVFRPYGEFHPSGAFFRFTDYGRHDDHENGGIVEFLETSEEYQAFLDMFTPFINGEKKGAFFFYSTEFIYGLPLLGYVLSKSLEGSSSEGIFLPWLHIFPERNDFYSTAPLVRSMNRKFISMIPGFITRTEEKVFKELPFPAMDLNMPGEEDAVLMFRIYLSAYIRYFRENNMPAVMFLDNVDNFSEGTSEAIADILRDFSEEYGLISVLFSSRPDVPACFQDYAVHKFRYEDCFRENTGAAVSPLSLYHEHVSKNRNAAVSDSFNPETGFLSELSIPARQLLYILSMVRESVDTDSVVDILADDDSEAAEFRRALEELVFAGYLYPGRNIPVLPIFPGNKSEYLAHAGNIFAEGVHKLFRQNRKGCPSCFKTFADACSYLGFDGFSCVFKLKTADLLVSRRNTKEALPLIKEVLSFDDAGRDGSKGLSLHAHALFLKAALTDSRVHLVDDLAHNILEFDITDDEAAETVRNLVLAEYRYSKYEFKESLIHAKKALIMAQNSGIQDDESAANSLIGKIMLGMQRIEEAKDYFRISREIVSENYNSDVLVKTLYLESAAHYIYGNVSESLRLLESGLELCVRSGLRNWQILYGFLKGRIHFDLGKYREAVKIFADCLAVGRLYQDTAGNSILYPWIARSMIYGGNGREGAVILEDYMDNAEGLFFYSEYLYFEGDFPSALDMINRSVSAGNDRIHPFFSPDFELKDSGFEYVEDLVFVEDSGHGVLHHLLNAFRAFVAVLNGRTDEGISDLMRLTRDEKLSDIDPFNGLYYFFHALSLPEKSDDDTLDRLTLLSKSLRHVQSIASRIDTPADRRAFLESGYWNSRLIDICRKNKLI